MLKGRATIAALLFGAAVSACSGSGAPCSEPDAGPTLDRTMVTPNPDQTIVMTASTTFSVADAVSEPCTGTAPLAYYWFINYPGNGLPEYASGTAAAGLDSLKIDPCAAKFRDLYGLVSGAPRVVELFVMDPTKGTVRFDTQYGRVFNGPNGYVLWNLDVQAVCP